MEVGKIVTIALIGFALVATLLGFSGQGGQLSRADQECIARVNFESSYQIGETEAAALCGVQIKAVEATL